jgi:hypothetical protein
VLLPFVIVLVPILATLTLALCLLIWAANALEELRR